jgi:hypothetical protein
MIVAMNASMVVVSRDQPLFKMDLPSPVLRTRATPLPETTLVPIKRMFPSSKMAPCFTPCESAVFRTDSLSPVRLHLS